MDIVTNSQKVQETLHGSKLTSLPPIIGTKMLGIMIEDPSITR
jgi:hypothetical protein